MRLLLAVISLALIAHANGVGDMIEVIQPPPFADEALALKCDHLESDLREDCVGRYGTAFRSGEIEPIAVLRMHCTRWQNPWEESRGVPPLMCVEQFGGWVVPEPS